MRAEEKAAGDPKKQKKLVKQRAPEGSVGWDIKTFERLQTAPSEGLVSRFDISHGMLLLVLSRESDGCRAMRQLIADCHETPHKKRALRTRAWQLFRALIDRQIVEFLPRSGEREQADSTATPFRALVVCPKSVTHGWLVESARFTPSVNATAFNPALANPDTQLSSLKPQLLVANYSQLRINSEWFRAQKWDAVILDEGQFIKNPGSQVASVARALLSRHRLVLTGTPIRIASAIGAFPPIPNVQLKHMIPMSLNDCIQQSHFAPG